MVIFKREWSLLYKLQVFGVKVPTIYQAVIDAIDELLSDDVPLVNSLSVKQFGANANESFS